MCVCVYLRMARRRRRRRASGTWAGPGRRRELVGEEGPAALCLITFDPAQLLASAGSLRTVGWHLTVLRIAAGSAAACHDVNTTVALQCCRLLSMTAAGSAVAYCRLLLPTAASQCWPRARRRARPGECILAHAQHGLSSNTMALITSETSMARQDRARPVRDSHNMDCAPTRRP